MTQRLAIVIITLALTGSAQAETRWHAGLNVRAELSTHPIRVGAGVQFGHVDTTLVLDPIQHLNTKGYAVVVENLLPSVELLLQTPPPLAMPAPAPPAAMQPPPPPRSVTR